MHELYASQSAVVKGNEDAPEILGDSAHTQALPLVNGPLTQIA